MAMQRNVILALIMFGLWSVASAETTQEKGLAIATEADRRDSGFRDFTTDIDMILRNRQGDESARRLRSRTLEVANDVDKSLVIFDEPADVKGTAFLSYTHAAGAGGRGRGRPARGRGGRGAAAEGAGPVMGSEFAYEDISSQEIAKYTYV